MSNAELINELFYKPDDPYHYLYDNIPLQVLNDRLEKVDIAADTAVQLVTDAIGSQPDLVSRLDQSQNADGSLISAAIDAALHNIASHSEGSINLGTSALAALNTATGLILTNPVPFVRFCAAERVKLSSMANNSTALKILLVTAAQTLDNQTIHLTDSDGITWNLSGGNILTANLGFSITTLHQHVYDEVPATTSFSGGLTTFTVASPSGYNSGSLRAFVNGIRLPKGSTPVKVPTWNSSVLSWVYRAYAEVSDTLGTFTISGGTFQSGDVVKVDYDISVD